MASIDTSVIIGDLERVSTGLVGSDAGRIEWQVNEDAGRLRLTATGAPLGRRDRWRIALRALDILRQSGAMSRGVDVAYVATPSGAIA